MEWNKWPASSGPEGQTCSRWKQGETFQLYDDEDTIDFQITCTASKHSCHGENVEQSTQVAHNAGF